LTASGLLPADWELVELNPAHVAEQRRVLGNRGVKTNQNKLHLLMTSPTSRWSS
jgi:hypothetical protein